MQEIPVSPNTALLSTAFIGEFDEFDETLSHIEAIAGLMVFAGADSCPGRFRERTITKAASLVEREVQRIRGLMDVPFSSATTPRCPLTSEMPRTTNRTGIP